MTTEEKILADDSLKSFISQALDKVIEETRRQTLEDVMILIERYAKESFEEVSNPDEVENDYEFPFYDNRIKEIVDEMMLACEVVECECGEPIKDWDICDSIRELKKEIESTPKIEHRFKKDEPSDKPKEDKIWYWQEDGCWVKNGVRCPCCTKEKGTGEGDRIT